jgi:hypothetical protein
MVVLNKELQSGFNTFLTAPRGGDIKPLRMNKKLAREAASMRVAGLLLQ